MADLNALRKQFGMPGVSFGMNGELAFVHVETPSAKMTAYLQGAHLTEWTPFGFEPVIFLSHTSKYLVGQQIRGGIPVVFPWFAGDTKKDRVDGHPGPSHGFAKAEEWTLASVRRKGDDAQLVLTLGPTAESRSMGFDAFALTATFEAGKELSFALTVENHGKEPLHFEEAFHAYYRVADVHEVLVTGLEQVSYIDKTDGYKVKPGGVIRFPGTVDRVYNNVSGPATIHDAAGRRRIVVEKHGSDSTIVWNPAKPLPDLSEWEWHNMVAVETGNVGVNAVTLAPGEEKTMGSRVTVERGA